MLLAMLGCKEEVTYRLPDYKVVGWEYAIYETTKGSHQHDDFKPIASGDIYAMKYGWECSLKIHTSGKYSNIAVMRCWNEDGAMVSVNNHSTGFELNSFQDPCLDTQGLALFGPDLKWTKMLFRCVVEAVHSETL